MIDQEETITLITIHIYILCIHIYKLCIHVDVYIPGQDLPWMGGFVKFRVRLLGGLKINGPRFITIKPLYITTDDEGRGAQRRYVHPLSHERVDGGWKGPFGMKADDMARGRSSNIGPI